MTKGTSQTTEKVMEETTPQEEQSSPASVQTDEKEVVLPVVNEHVAVAGAGGGQNHKNTQTEEQHTSGEAWDATRV